MANQQTMRAVDIKGGKGPASALFISDSVPKPATKPSECLVKIKAFGINRADTLQREGNYPVPPGVTNIMGLEFAGTVAEVGSDASDETRHHWQVGDEVFGLTYGGGYAEYVAVSKKMLLKKPKELSWEACAGTPEVWMTALQALHLVGEYHPATTRSILWHAGASSVSMAGIQLSHHAVTHSGHNPGSNTEPPKIFATARSEEKCQHIKTVLPLTAAINTEKYPQWSEEVQRQNGGQGMDLVIDYVGASYFQQNLNVLARDGHMVILGLMGGRILPSPADKDGKVDIAPLLGKRLRIEGSTLRSRDEPYQAKLRDLFEDLVLPGLISGEFTTHVDRVESWTKIAECHSSLERNETKGKIVCLVD